MTGWGDARYMYGNESQLSPWDRSAKNGFRCALYPDREKILEKLFEEDFWESPDPRKMETVNDSVFEVYRAQFDYDKSELEPHLERRDESPEDWIHEKVSFNAAYDGERVTMHLFLPKGSSPPYQSVIYFPGSPAVGGKPFFEELPWEFSMNLDYLIKNGRTVVYPVYKGTYERTGDLDIDKHWPTEEYRHEYTGYLVRWVKDLRRTIDYLQTREDFDPERIAFLGFSWGGIIGGIAPAVENRLRTVILYLGALHTGFALPEAHGVNYAPRITQPTLMLNGRYDAVLPLETHARPLFELLGTPEADKKLIVHESDHGVSKRERIKETLAWLDKYLGPVE